MKMVRKSSALPLILITDNVKTVVRVSLFIFSHIIMKQITHQHIYEHGNVNKSSVMIEIFSNLRFAKLETLKVFTIKAKNRKKSYCFLHVCLKMKKNFPLLNNNNNKQFSFFLHILIRMRLLSQPKPRVIGNHSNHHPILRWCDFDSLTVFVNRASTFNIKSKPNDTNNLCFYRRLRVNMLKIESGVEMPNKYKP